MIVKSNFKNSTKTSINTYVNGMNNTLITQTLNVEEIYDLFDLGSIARIENMTFLFLF